MKIKNISFNASWNGVFICTCLSAIYIALDITVMHFDFLKREIFNNTLVLLIFFGMQLAIFVCFIWAVIERQVTLSRIHSESGLQSVKLNDEKIFFNFTNPQCNLSYTYDNIENISMRINTMKVHDYSRMTNTRFGDEYRTISGQNLINEINITFTLLNGKKFTVSTAPNPFIDPTMLNFISNFLNYKNKFKTFSYDFKGPKNQLIIDLFENSTEKINSVKANNKLCLELVKWSALFLITGYFSWIFLKRFMEDTLYYFGYTTNSYLFPLTITIIGLILLLIAIIIFFINKSKHLH